MGELRERMKEDLRLRNVRPTTAESYLNAVRRFTAFFGKSPEEMGCDEVRAFLLHLLDKGRSPSTVKVYRAALVFLYAETLQRPVAAQGLPMPRYRRPIPVVPTTEEVAAILAATTSVYFRTLFATVYATGLRSMEVRHLQVSDIDSRAGVVRVREGKGGRPREVKLGDRNLQMLRRYWQHCRPPGPWLFPARRSGAPGHQTKAHPWGRRPVENDRINAALREACSRAGISRRVTLHSFRHAFATHLLESGHELRVIQSLLGHMSLSTTVIYTHVRRDLVRKTKSPLDLLDNIPIV